MKNKFLAIAASIAALGTAIVSAPAQAQIVGTPTPVNLSVQVPEVLYLRTVSDIFVGLTAADLASGLNPSGTGYYGSDNTSGTVGTNPLGGPAGTGVNTGSPFAVTGPGSFNQSLPNVYAVWSNSPRPGGVNITYNKGGSLSGTLNAVSPATGSVAYTIASTSNQTGKVPQGLVNPTYVGALDLTLDLTGATTAGSYTGVITVTADAP
ncbi:MAG: hypothetical protein HWQ41_01025 [Nostoc sp. NOS(2021)]|uniref:hypothetical protein n=1 Tax=Nostoc sp. NOS(2021) TaxID=2815407 RepID=UPI0025D39038|nr:hypothetical protein [Nostoc sp. NOS(2021)]MBN3893922.1 hypothetical protein [Nostoc sp. NOS(2021)]